MSANTDFGAVRLAAVPAPQAVRQHKVYDQTVFVTYSIAFMSIGLIALTLLELIRLPDTISSQ